MVSLNSYLLVSAILFSLGALGVLIRKNAIVIFMCIELMLNAVNLALIAFSRYLNNLDGQIFVFFIMTVAAAEAAVGLALMIAFYKNRESIDVESVNTLKW
ncbi:MAG: NADH-quinone oxidoreductase subunit NuoK [Desulfuromonadia bacterium]